MAEIRIIEFATPEYDMTIQLRNLILRIPLGLEFKVEDLAKEYSDIHLAYYNDYHQLTGCLVLTKINSSVLKMRQVAVLEDAQGKGIGTELVLASELLAKEQNYNKIVLNARDVSLPFYHKLNYQKIGESFIEVGIKHYKMEKIL